MPIGLDDPKKARRPMSIGKALAEDTLLVYAMNGQVLPPDHGFPFRILVPGWLGAASIKWVGRIEVSEQPLYSPWNTESYVLIGANYKASPPAKGEIITSQNIKSAFELAWDGELSAGRHLLRGRSWSAGGKIAKVEVSIDGGKNWQQARLREPNLALAWARWDIDWNAQKGDHNLLARATDDKGNTQPLAVPFNQKGYMYNAVVSHPVRVS
jgi:DMSO/TMAO reductase YedYZ molybdopterin-dependent catalytic subunit